MWSQESLLENVSVENKQFWTCLFRYGQKRRTFIYRLVANNTMEKRMYDRQLNKQVRREVRTSGGQGKDKETKNRQMEAPLLTFKLHNGVIITLKYTEVMPII